MKIFSQNCLYHKRKSSILWNTNRDKFNTSYEVDLTFKLPEFCPSKEITHSFAVDETENEHTYDVILGRDLLTQLGMDILCSKGRIVWDDISIPMKKPAEIQLKELGQKTREEFSELEEVMHQFDDYSDPVLEATARATEILDADYAKISIDDRKIISQSLICNYASP